MTQVCLHSAGAGCCTDVCCAQIRRYYSCNTPALLISTISTVSTACYAATLLTPMSSARSEPSSSIMLQGRACLLYFPATRLPLTFWSARPLTFLRLKNLSMLAQLGGGQPGAGRVRGHEAQLREAPLSPRRLLLDLNQHTSLFTLPIFCPGQCGVSRSHVSVAGLESRCARLGGLLATAGPRLVVPLVARLRRPGWHRLLATWVPLPAGAAPQVTPAQHSSLGRWRPGPRLVAAVTTDTLHPRPWPGRGPPPRPARPASCSSHPAGGGALCWC